MTASWDVIIREMRSGNYPDYIKNVSEGKAVPYPKNSWVQGDVTIDHAITDEKGDTHYHLALLQRSILWLSNASDFVKSVYLNILMANINAEAVQKSIMTTKEVCVDY